MPRHFPGLLAGLIGSADPRSRSPLPTPLVRSMACPLPKSQRQPAKGCPHNIRSLTIRCRTFDGCVLQPHQTTVRLTVKPCVAGRSCFALQGWARPSSPSILAAFFSRQYARMPSGPFRVDHWSMVGRCSSNGIRGTP